MPDMLLFSPGLINGNFGITAHLNAMFQLIFAFELLELIDDSGPSRQAVSSSARKIFRSGLQIFVLFWEEIGPILMNQTDVARCVSL